MQAIQFKNTQQAIVDICRVLEVAHLFATSTGADS
jgi:hypothetical protein